MLIFMAVINAFTSFKIFGGAELIALNLSKGLSKIGFDVTLTSFSKLEDINPNYDFNNINYKRFNLSFIFSLKINDTVISHHRMVTTILLIFKTFFRRSYKIIHVAHNEFYNFKYFTLFPNIVVAVSNKVKLNLINVFDLQDDKIQVIYNGINDISTSSTFRSNKFDEVKILYPARITSVKQQIEIVNKLKGNLPKYVKIYFAGEGPDSEKLNKLIHNDYQFVNLGFSDMHKIVNDFDYIFLFSKVEGLPTVLLEACMFSKPIICNDIGGNLEILNPGINGFLVNDIDLLKIVLSNLPLNNSIEYLTLSKNSRIVFEEKFRLDIMLNRYSNLLSRYVEDNTSTM